MRLAAGMLCLIAGCEPVAIGPPEAVTERLPAKATQFTSLVISVTDGDTLTILTNEKQQVKIRLHGIDAPERGQPYGNNAKSALGKLVGHRVVIVDQGDGSFGRRAADIYQPGSKDSFNLQLVQAGLAWWSPKYSNDERLGLAEAEARKAKRGLWAAQNGHPIINPAKWRTLSKVERDRFR